MAGRRTQSGIRAKAPLPRVLIVDDTEDNRELFAAILTGIGYEVAVATDGVDAIEAARAIKPSVIVMDLGMPVLDGFGATRAIRADEEIGHVHIIAVTAFSDRTSERRALEAGCNEVLTKPCAPSVLAARVAQGARAALASNASESQAAG